jgi:hypothetical protein
MLKWSDSRNFGRTLAAIGLVAGPLLLMVGSLVDPAWSDDSAEYVQEVADASGRYVVAGAVWTIGTLLFVAGALGLVRLLRRRAGITLGQAGATLLTVGLIALTPALAFNALEVAVVDTADQQTAAAISDASEDSVALAIYFFGAFLGGIVLGSLLLAVALIRRRIVPIWSPILLIVSMVAAFAIGNTSVGSALSFLLLTAALVPLALLIWSLRDDDWERWEPLEAMGRAGKVQPAVSSPMPSTSAPAETEGPPVGTTQGRPDDSRIG